MENAGVTLSKRGVHIGDIDTQTNIPNIYVVGDASGHISCKCWRAKKEDML